MASIFLAARGSVHRAEFSCGGSHALERRQTVGRFVGRDLVLVRQRQADVVQAVQQAMAAERLDLERNRQARARR